MGALSRARHLLAANVGDLLDRAEDPAKLVRLMIAEMEETLVEVRASAARTIADQREMQRHAHKLERLQADWADKAELALSKGREDLARAALGEKRKAAELGEQLTAEAAALDDTLIAYEADIDRVQQRLGEARRRQRAIAARLESAQNQVKLRTLLAREKADEARARFDALERRVDDAEGRAGALGLGQDPDETDIARQIDALAASDPIEAELGALKARQRNSAEES